MSTGNTDSIFVKTARRAETDLHKIIDSGDGYSLLRKYAKELVSRDLRRIVDETDPHDYVKVEEMWYTKGSSVLNTRGRATSTTYADEEKDKWDADIKRMFG
jgi:hypothetical protein